MFLVFRLSVTQALKQKMTTAPGTVFLGKRYSFIYLTPVTQATQNIVGLNICGETLLNTEETVGPAQFMCADLLLEMDRTDSHVVSYG